MRTRPEILQDATRRTEKGVMIPECSDKIKLLTLEVFIDIRDVLQTYIKVAQDLQDRLLPKT